MTEIILIIVIIALVFGVGQLPKLASTMRRMRVQFLEGMGTSDEPIDITPESASKTEGARDETRKPGKFDQEVAEAHIVEDSERT